MLLALITSAASLAEPPSAPALSEGPSLRARVSARPRLKVLKRLQAKGNRLLLGGSCDSAGRCSFEAKCAEPLLGGTIALSGRSLRWSRLWLLPGLADAATRVEVCSAVDLRTGKPDAELRRGLSLVHAVPLSLPLGGEQARLRETALEARGTRAARANVPAEVTLSARDPRAALRSARFSVDIDRADLCVEY
ncbi:hypothetical protein EMIHUDRAFT_208370 [Emiliania huxleyi CCMP1516]|uniref:Uncharacterized protein n=2 Tax=Emiliania huxleyi TaxID=2903 RepID=A0A0D3JAF8_EMIH1|nr:hypothetical protein EMIHUDRAFT_249177 [Emiliania huxleyi CCMP1516]XP_005772922.1 hypothetical protein EMIHUDRAFT_208370 [Emiliania huxleyi CCMP1516]EOD08261.1 hypothetical protein EMIHUDRAFT_249177 [Emiliania huxleyi CCMP1516]EOD20493.1 hypothetical protein EMIHUDRAFT_208370 [Emiliania huxleyi CCMP1516]|eukprot:XP_005760690.1 hypothetical protein EMIHUDRAFT_249177 [Emiliania huxleyi CCMP1516]